MTTTTKIQPPYLEDTGLDGKKIYTPREWTERFRHYVKRINNIDIKQILTDDAVPIDANWDTKEPEIRQDFIWGAGQSAIEIITKGEFNTDPDTIKIEKLIQLFREYYMPKRTTYHSRGDFFWAKQGDTRGTLEKTSNTGNELRFQEHKTGIYPHIKIHHEYNRQKTP